MKTDTEYLRPEYTTMFGQIQDFIAEQLNSDIQLSATGITFHAEHKLDIEYEIKRHLGQQGIVGVVNTLKGEYSGHNGSTQAWQIEAEIDVIENPPVRRAQMKKMGLSAGTASDLLDWIQESMCGPSSPTYGKFSSMRQELGEEGGLVVGKATMRTIAVADVSGIVSGQEGWHIPYALQSDLSALSVQVMDLSAYVYDLSVDVPTKISELENDVGFVTSADAVMKVNTSQLVVTVPYDNGLDIRNPGNQSLLKTIDLNRVAIGGLSAGRIEVGGDIVNYGSPWSQDLSAWNWLKSGSTGLGDALDGLHDGIMDEVAEDYASYNWLNRNVWQKSDTQLSVGNSQYKTTMDPGAVVCQRTHDGTVQKTMYAWDGLTYSVSGENGLSTANIRWPLDGRSSVGDAATREWTYSNYVTLSAFDAALGDVSTLIHET